MAQTGVDEDRDRQKIRHILQNGDDRNDPRR